MGREERQHPVQKGVICEISLARHTRTSVGDVDVVRSTRVEGGWVVARSLSLLLLLLFLLFPFPGRSTRTLIKPHTPRSSSLPDFKKSWARGEAAGAPTNEGRRMERENEWSTTRKATQRFLACT